MSMPDLHQPVFVVGHPRSGTTLLATVLGRHSQLSMPPETQFLIEQRALLEQTQLEKAQMQAVLDNRRVADLGLEAEDVLARFTASDRSPRAAFACLIDSYRAREGKPRGGEKSPLHLLHTETLMNWFPEARILCIERNGADVVASMMRMPWAHRNFVKHVFSWCDALRLARAYETRFAGRFMRVSFEAFTAEPEAQTRAICAFCDLPFEPAMLAPEQEAGTVPDWEKGWKEAVNRPVSAQPSCGMESLSPAQRATLGALANPALRRAGYAPAPVGRLQAMLIWLKAWPYHHKAHPFFARARALFRR